jgi:hypothetical protein
MFSAFSFGKIIKTILPGSILTAALLLVLECVWALAHPAEGFLLGKIPEDWVTPVTAALVPVSLTLGFFLNTFTWIVLNPRMRVRCDDRLNPTGYCAMRKGLSESMLAETVAHFAKGGRALDQTNLLPRPALEYYYLPLVGLTNLNYLWESYFCWYEFDINSACALVACLPAAGCLYWVRSQNCPWALSLTVLVLLSALAVAAFWGLSRAAVRNLAAYEKNLMLLITGAVVADARKPASPPTGGSA